MRVDSVAVIWCYLVILVIQTKLDVMLDGFSPDSPKPDLPKP